MYVFLEIIVNYLLQMYAHQYGNVLDTPQKYLFFLKGGKVSHTTDELSSHLPKISVY